MYYPSFETFKQLPNRGNLILLDELDDGAVDFTRDIKHAIGNCYDG